MAEDLSFQLRAGTRSEVYKLLLDNPKVNEFVSCPDMAHIALSSMLDAVGDGVAPTTTLTSLYALTGERIEDQARLVFAQAVQPKFFEFIKERYLSTTKSYNQKMKQVRMEHELRAMQDPLVEWDSWSYEEQVEVGAWACWIIQQTTQWFQEVQTKTDSQEYPTTKFLVLSEEGLRDRDTILEFASKNAFTRFPMLVKPKDWTLDESGGYLLGGPGDTSQLIHGSLINTVPSESAIAFLNNVQGQAFKINTWILDFMRILLETNTEISTFVSYRKRSFIRPEFPDSVWELPDDSEEKMRARQIIAEARSKEVELKNKGIAPKQVVELADMFKHAHRFYIPWFFDSRLRAYPLVSKLSPQGSDYQKALLLFADGAEVTPDNRAETQEVLLIAIGTTWGNKIDKESFAGRLEWARKHVADNLDLILQSPLSPASMAIWTKADEPFQHLALLKEYHDIFVVGTSNTCAVPIGYDATCSGLQLLGSFVKDEVTCKLVNVTPSDRPQDAYAAVARAAQEILRDPAQWTALKGREEDVSHNIPVEKIDRKVAKKVVMLIPYGGKYDTLKKHVEEAVKDWDLSVRDLHTLTKALIAGMAVAVPGFSALNKWFKEAAKAVMHQRKDSVSWQTAAGSTVHQIYNQSQMKDIFTHALGVSRYKERISLDDGTDQVIPMNKQSRGQYTTLSFDTDKVNPRKHVTALAANWTHSQDACVLQLAFADFDRPFTTVHDCVYAPAPVIRAAVKEVRRSFVKVTSWDALHNFLSVNEVDIPLPPFGSADTTQALYSEYLFS